MLDLAADLGTIPLLQLPLAPQLNPRPMASPASFSSVVLAIPSTSDIPSTSLALTTLKALFCNELIWESGIWGSKAPILYSP